MTSAIDPTKPTNANPKFLHMRANFAAAKTEIEALQSANAELQATVLVIQSTASIPLMAL